MVAWPFGVCTEVPLIEPFLPADVIDIRASALPCFGELVEQQGVSLTSVPMCLTLAFPEFGTRGQFTARACEVRVPGGIS